MVNYSAAVYCANFGNYRDELKNGIDNIIFDKNIDYYFFTDNKNIKSSNWNIIFTPLQPNLDFIDACRHTSKYVKFVIPEILHKYDIIIWSDSKFLDKLNINKQKIVELFTKDDNSLFFYKHEGRYHARQELQVTLKFKLEHLINGEEFLKEVQKMNFKTHLPETTLFCFSNKIDNILLLKNVYDTLISKGLRRDQNVIQYVLLKNNFESKVSYFNFKDVITFM